MGLVIALNKGRIFEECLPLLAACQIQPSDDPKKSRKLIFDSVTGGHKIIVARSADVPTYVENGVADVGITGKDTILEYGEDMTSKFVNIARRYYQDQSKQVSLVKLSGALEIAPLLGLADCIVDIVDTGNTLKANGLEARETICDISTRLIVNRASMKTKFDEVQTLIQQLEGVVAANASGGQS